MDSTTVPNEPAEGQIWIEDGIRMRIVEIGEATIRLQHEGYGGCFTLIPRALWPANFTFGGES